MSNSINNPENNMLINKDVLHAMNNAWMCYE